MRVRIAFTGRSYQQADAWPEELELGEAATVADALDALQKSHPDAQLPPTCLIVLSGQHLGTVGDRPTASLSEGDELVLVSPVAGG